MARLCSAAVIQQLLCGACVDCPQLVCRFRERNVRLRKVDNDVYLRWESAHIQSAGQVHHNYTDRLVLRSPLRIALYSKQLVSARQA